MKIPPRLAAIIADIIADIDSAIAVLQAERAELLALLAPYTEQPAHVAAPVLFPQKQQLGAIMPRRVRGGTDRQERTRADGQVEYLYGHGGYTCAADRLMLGTVDTTGRWLTIPEWKKVRQEDYRHREAARRGEK